MSYKPVIPIIHNDIDPSMTFKLTDYPKLGRIKEKSEVFKLSILKPWVVPIDEEEEEEE
ncbi:MAG: hypothetical protein ACOH2R_08640 [Pseudomonas sp.]